MMGIVQLFTEQNVRSLHRTLLDLVKSGMAHEAMTHAEEQVGVVGRQTGQGIKCVAINGDRDRSREDGTLVEGEPVGMMII
jgi:hypothetical protein